jgi:hypothetical protein
MPGTGDAELESRRVRIAVSAQEDAEDLTETEGHLVDAFLDKVSDEEAEAARARADELARKHGPDYHGFGHPPKPDDEPDR